MKPANHRQLWLKLHLSLGALFVPVGLSGSANMFFQEIDEAESGRQNDTYPS